MYDSEMEDIKEYVYYNLDDSCLFDEIQVGSDIDKDYVPEIETKRDIYARRQDGEEFLIIANADTYRSEESLIEKIDGLTDNGVYFMPILYGSRIETENGSEEVFNKSVRNHSHYRSSIDNYPDDLIDKMIATKLTERSFMDHTNGKLVYFDGDEEKLTFTIFDRNYPIIGNYEDNPRVPDFKKEEKLTRPEIKSKERDIEKFVPGRDLNNDRYLVSLPIDTTDLWNDIKDCKSLVDEGQCDHARSKIDIIEEEIEVSKFPNNIYEDELKEIVENIDTSQSTDFEQLRLF